MGSLLRRTALLAVALSAGCIDWGAAGRCYDPDASGCEEPRDATPMCGAAVASRCSGQAAVLCEGFEDTFLNPLWFVRDNPPAQAATLDETRACRGDASLHLHLDAVAQGESPVAQIEEQRSEEPTPLADRWIRLFLYLPVDAVTSNANRLVGLVQSGAPFSALDLIVEGGALSLSNGFSGQMTYSTTQLPTDRWVCAQLRVVAGSPGEVQVWLDGQPVDDLHITDETSPSPPIGTVLFGAALYQAAAQGALDLWIDEVVVDGAPLDCSS